MDTLPPELHSLICQFAASPCLSLRDNKNSVFPTKLKHDGGRTIRSLNRVSKYFYAISKPFLYTVISVCGVGEVKSILEMFRQELGTQGRGSQKLNVWHLFLSDLPIPKEFGLKEESASNPTSIPQALPSFEIQSIVRLLTMCAPTLQSLTFISAQRLTSATLIGRLYRVHFPHLHSLSIHGFYPFPSTPPPINEESRSNFPSVRYLHLNGNRSPHGLLQIGCLDEAFPNLKELKVTGLGPAMSFLDEVRCALSAYTRVELANGVGCGLIFPSDARSITDARFPRQLRKFAIQAGPPQKVNSGVNTVAQELSLLKDWILVDRLDVLKMSSIHCGNEIGQKEDLVQFTVLDRSERIPTLTELWESWSEGV